MEESRVVSGPLDNVKATFKRPCVPALVVAGTKRSTLFDQWPKANPPAPSPEDQSSADEK